VQFELGKEEVDSDESTELDEEEEQLTSVVKRSGMVRKVVERYSPPEFSFAFMLTTIDDDPKSVGEVVDSAKGKL
jgi:hypothetical protein